MDILYYSKNCAHCKKLIPYLVKNRLQDKLNFICIDNRIKDPMTQQLYVVLENGSKVVIPPNVHRVPSLISVKEKYRVISGDEIYGYLQPAVQQSTNLAVGNAGEPTGYILGQSSSGITSEAFTPYDASPHDLSVKGVGGMRQLYNYASANDNGMHMNTPEETYRPDKIREDTTLDSLQQKRNEELQTSLPPLVAELNQAIMPNYGAGGGQNMMSRQSGMGRQDMMYPPREQYMSMSIDPIMRNPSMQGMHNSYAPLNGAPKFSSEDVRERLFGNGSGWMGEQETYKKPPTALSGI